MIMLPQKLSNRMYVDVTRNKLESNIKGALLYQYGTKA